MVALFIAMEDLNCNKIDNMTRKTLYYAVLRTMKILIIEFHKNKCSNIH